SWLTRSGVGRFRMTPTAPPPGWRVTSTTVSRKLGSASSGLATSRTPLGASCAAAAAASNPRAAARRPVLPDMPQLVYASARRRALRGGEEDQGRQVVRDAVEVVADGGADEQDRPGLRDPVLVPDAQQGPAAQDAVHLVFRVRILRVRRPRRQRVDAHA